MALQAVGIVADLALLHISELGLEAIRDGLVAVLLLFLAPERHSGGVVAGYDTSLVRGAGQFA